MTTEEVPLAPPEEQFVTAQQQRHAATFGMWIFLATEVLFFGGLLVIYSAYRTWYPNDFATGSRHLDIVLGTLNTAILLTSSFLMAGAVTAALAGAFAAGLAGATGASTAAFFAGAFFAVA